MKGQIQIHEPKLQVELQARAGHVLSAGRPGTFNSDSIARDLSRYYRTLSDALTSVDLTPGEASLICDALNGCWMRELGGLDGLGAKTALLAECGDHIALNSADRKWDVQEGPLVAKLSALSELQAVAILDAVERFWADTETSPADVGLCAPESPVGS